VSAELDRESADYKAGYLLGYFATYELHEVDAEWRSTVSTLRLKYAKRMQELGIAETPSFPVIEKIQREMCFGSCTLKATLSNGEEVELYSFYIDELSFSNSELVGKTVDEAHALRQKKDTEYLRS